jgi:hypothetical protein
MKLELVRFGTTSSDDVSPLAAELRGLGFEVDEGVGFEKSADVVAGLTVVVWLVTDETAREFVRLGLRYLIDWVLGISRTRGATKADIWFRAGGEEGTELRTSVRSDEPDALKTIERIVGRLADVGIVTAMEKLPEGERMAYLSLLIGEDIHCRTGGTKGQFYFYDTTEQRWKPRRRAK